MINASIVLYKHSFKDVEALITTLLSTRAVSTLYLIDNSPAKTPEFENIGAHYFFVGKNAGYGAGHNIAIRKTIEANIPYHLVLNPDIELKTEILGVIENFMNKNSEIGLLMPKILFPDGEIQYLCKLLPTPFDLIFRRFLPSSWTKKRTEKFELRSSGYNKTMDVPYLSGCFMFLRTDALKKAGLFDERFFMYPEDIDLTRRINSDYKTVFYPGVSVVHQYEKGSYKGFKLLFIHTVNMIRYFCKWGWIFDRERKERNKETLQKLGLEK